MPAETKMKLERALEHLLSAVKYAPEVPQYSALLGKAWLLQGEPERAVEPLRTAFAIDSPPSTAYLLALSLYGAGNLGEAENYASTALEDNPVFARAFALRALCRHKRRALIEAIEDLWEACALAPANEIFRLQLCALLIEQAFRVGGASQEKLLSEARDRLVASEPVQFGAERDYLLGCCFLQLGEPRRALLHLERTAFPSSREVSLRLGIAQLLLGNREAAEACFKTARTHRDIELVADRYLTLIDEGGSAVPGHHQTPPPRLDGLPRLRVTDLLPGAQASAGNPSRHLPLAVERPTASPIPPPMETAAREATAAADDENVKKEPTAERIENLLGRRREEEDSDFLDPIDLPLDALDELERPTLGNPNRRSGTSDGAAAAQDSTA